MTDDRNLIICRCREVTKQDILDAIAGGATTVDGVKRRSTACMGLCQGKTCERLVCRIIADVTGKNPADILPMKSRMPSRPIKMSVIGGKDNE